MPTGEPGGAALSYVLCHVIACEENLNNILGSHLLAEDEYHVAEDYWGSRSSCPRCLRLRLIFA